MDILSYRGPGSPGGVSGAVSRILERYATSGSRWWHLTENAMFVRQTRSPTYVCEITKRIVEGHYRYCNNFLWPIMHDLPEFASFSAEDRTLYQQFNLAFAANVLRREALGLLTSYFVQDYQLALVPGIIASRLSRRTALFWHIPWPKFVREEYVPLLVEIAVGLLAATRVGFHIDEYAINFLEFVHSYLPEFSVDYEKQVVSPITTSLERRTACEVIVQPLGLDIEFWKQQSNQGTVAYRHNLARQLASGQYVLSVDRADYTKGVLERLQSINEFFEMNPSWRNQITFVQLCQRTRIGLNAFDSYWTKCVAMVAEVNARWAQDSWKPIVWVDEPVSPAVLAAMYECAAAMLVNPLRDGLNLTAKEFVACAGDTAGILLMSSSAGTWQEFGEHAFPVTPLQPGKMAQSIANGLSIPQSERRMRLQKMRESLQANNLSVWWQRFAGKTASELSLTTVRRLPLSTTRKTTLKEFSAVAR